MDNFAVVSDIHSNIAAFKAVLEDIKKYNPCDVVCLGDIVGYGPDPKKAVSMVRRNCSIVVKGNHDQAAIEYPQGFNQQAHDAIVWTKKSLKSLRLFSSEVRMNWNFLRRLPDSYSRDGMLFVHGSPRDPISEYIDEDDTFCLGYGGREKLEDIFSLIEQICFCGHTHIPGIITDELEFFTPEDFNNEFAIKSGRKLIVNVGSVGQPRDSLVESSYVLVKDNKILYKRVKYDVDATTEKIISNPSLSNSLANRLYRGL